MQNLWPAAPWPPLPSAGSVAALALRLDLPAARLERLRALLSPDERARAARFSSPPLRERYEAGRGQVREILGGALGRDPASLQLQEGPRGKPALVGGGLEFNFSNSGDAALLALSRAGPIGADVELHRDRALEGVARRFFAPAEVERLLRLPPADRRAGFYSFWTAKEAFLKCTGEGITAPLADFEARFTAGAAGHIEVLRGPRASGRYWLLSLPAGPGASAALVGEGAMPPVLLWRAPAAGGQ